MTKHYLKPFIWFWWNHFDRLATETQFATEWMNTLGCIVEQTSLSKFCSEDICRENTSGGRTKWLNCVRFIDTNVQIKSVTAGCWSAKVQVKCLWWRGFAKSRNILCFLMNCQENPSQFKAQPLCILSKPCLHKSLVWPLLHLVTDPLVRSQACVWRRPWPVNIGQSSRANGARLSGMRPLEARATCSSGIMQLDTAIRMMKHREFSTLTTATAADHSVPRVSFCPSKMSWSGPFLILHHRFDLFI